MAAKQSQKQVSSPIAIDTSSAIPVSGRVKMQNGLAVAETILGGIGLILTVIGIGIGNFASLPFMVITFINVLIGIIDMISGGLGLVAFRNVDERRRRRLTVAHFVACIIAAIMEFAQLIVFAIFVFRPYLPSPQIAMTDGSQQDWRGVIAVTFMETFVFAAHMICSIESSALICNDWFPGAIHKDTSAMVCMSSQTTEQCEVTLLGMKSLEEDGARLNAEAPKEETTQLNAKAPKEEELPSEPRAPEAVIDELETEEVPKLRADLEVSFRKLLRLAQEACDEASPMEPPQKHSGQPGMERTLEEEGDTFGTKL